MKFKELIFVVLLAGGFLIPPAIAGQWWLFGVFALFFACFGIVEMLAVKITGKTVSQMFWDLKKRNKTMAWIIIGGMLVAWLSLLWHFIG